MASAPHDVSQVSTSLLGLRPTLDLPEQHATLTKEKTNSKRTVDKESYDDLLWNALGSALQTSTAGTRELVLVVDDIDESSYREKALLYRL
ncbi:hypothetical protein PENNAL_c0013G08205 [Penicillium nalgiovense]|uniref:Orc1-like AAA ATPase domain-containing protein n=1 Tax=Penicillium nalgiovense TaxID=60175 RepID=A0A1V6YR36_PENNA|nr:hypothetical protein PENNAL_c0013G08205 [Penicillium nalgiovense]